MKRLLKIGDVVRISAKNKEYADLTYEVRIVEVSDKMAKGRQVMYDGSISMLGYYCFNKNYDTEDLVAKPYGKDPFNQWETTSQLDTLKRLERKNWYRTTSV